MPPLRLASLGNSFAAGPGIPPVSDAKAARSRANYAHLLSARLGGASLSDLAVSGATLRNILDEPQVVDKYTTFAPQIEGLPPDTDVVLILGGGNDIGYIGGLFMDSFDAYWFLRVATRVYRWFRPVEPEKEPPLDAEALATRYGEVLDAVHARAPGARVLVVEYLTVVGDHVKPGVHVPFDNDSPRRRLAHHREVAEQVRVATVKAVQGRREAEGEPSAGHGMGAERPWVSGWSWRLLFAGGVYHPNAEGMAAVAEMIHEKMLDLGIAAADQE
ncbi:SGNH hydrolase [Apiospora phragmitis]|uniref:SGNH hydrolase n=1 Tax=Apiospora phragmitis TaxID=2905665 RepID=A0ABR1WVE1_9PEZI